MDRRADARSLRKPPIEREHGQIKSLCERDVQPIVERHVRAQLPGTFEQTPVSRAANRQVGEVGERSAGSVGAQLSGNDCAPQCVARLGIDQMRSPERSRLGEHRVASLVGKLASGEIGNEH